MAGGVGGSEGGGGGAGDGGGDATPSTWVEARSRSGNESVETRQFTEASMVMGLQRGLELVATFWKKHSLRALMLRLNSGSGRHALVNTLYICFGFCCLIAR